MARWYAALAMPIAALLASSPTIAHRPSETAATAAIASDAPAERTLFALTLRPGPAWKPGRPFAEQGLRPHFDYWMAQFRAGGIVTAGPVGGDSGLVLLLAGNLAEAQSIMRADPAVSAGIFLGEVQPYAPPMVNAEALPRKK